MKNLWNSTGTPGCAARCMPTPPTRTVRSLRGRSSKHYERAGYDVLAITDHWFRSAPPSTEARRRDPECGTERLLPGDRDGHVLAYGIEDGLAEFEGERRDLAATAEWITAQGGVAYLAHPYWTGATPGTLELPDTVSGIEVFNAGCELDSAGDSPPSTGTCCSTRVGCATRSPATTATTRASTPTSPGPGSGPSRPRGRARRAPHRLFLQHVGGRASRPSSRVEAPLRSSAIRAARSGSSSGSRVGQPSTRAGSDTATAARSSPPTPTGSTAARLDLPERARMPGSRSPTSVAAGPGRTHCTPEPGGSRARRAGTRPVRPARGRKRDRRCRDRERGCAPGPPGRSRRPQ